MTDVCIASMLPGILNAQNIIFWIKFIENIVYTWCLFLCFQFILDGNFTRTPRRSFADPNFLK